MDTKATFVKGGAGVQSRINLTTPTPRTPQMQEQEDYICTKSFQIVSGHVTVRFERGQVIDDPHLLSIIEKAFPDQRLPVRKLNPLDLV